MADTFNAAELRSVTFAYRGTETSALSDVSLSAAAGETVAVVGLSGAGKSTLLRCFNRIVPAGFKGNFSGTVALFGEDIEAFRPPELADRVGLVFQDFDSQLFSSTAELDVAHGPENLGLERDEIVGRVGRSLRAVGMEDLARRDPATLSGGQKQRLAIASVLSLEPRLLCLDEPVTDLDPAGRREVGDLAASLMESGVTVIIAEHELELLARAERAVALERGRVVFEGPMKTLLDNPERLAALGVRPPDPARLFYLLGLPERPPNAEQAAWLLREKGMTPEATPDGLEDGPPAAELSLAIRVEGLCHVYKNGVEALRGVDLDIGKGEFLAVLGRNGSGKTTLAKHFNRLLLPSGGNVFIGGSDSRELGAADVGRRVGYVFQNPDSQIFASTVREEVCFAPRNYGVPESELDAKLAEALELVGLAGYEDRDPFLLTKGERQRVALASVLVVRPEVLIMDEPTTGLDYPAQRAVMDLLASLNAGGTTIVIITHSIWVAAEYARRTVVMDAGKVLFDGPTREALASADLLGKAGLAMPGITELGLLLGLKVLSVEELAEAIKKGAA